jgi:hypothetical protein
MASATQPDMVPLWIQAVMAFGLLPVIPLRHSTYGFHSPTTPLINLIGLVFIVSCF